MRIIPPSAFTAMPWKNGGGVTHEILKREHAGQLLWRLSIAEVASDGPFSLFSGLSRILTVIDGPGLELTAPDRSLMALPMIPTAFSGDWPIDSRRLGGTVRDFNVIFDARAIAAEVIAKNRDQHVELPRQDRSLNAMLCLAGGTANACEVPPGSLVVAEDAEVDLFCKAPALQLALCDRTIAGN